MKHACSFLSVLLFAAMPALLRAQGGPPVPVYLEASSLAQEVGRVPLDAPELHRAEAALHPTRRAEGWYWTEMPGRYTGYVKFEEITEELGVAPQSRVRLHPSLRSPSFAVMDGSEPVEIREIGIGEWVKITFEKSVPVYFQRPDPLWEPDPAKAAALPEKTTRPEAEIVQAPPPEAPAETQATAAPLTADSPSVNPVNTGDPADTQTAEAPVAALPTAEAETAPAAAAAPDLSPEEALAEALSDPEIPLSETAEASPLPEAPEAIVAATPPPAEADSDLPPADEVAPAPDTATETLTATTAPTQQEELRPEDRPNPPIRGKFRPEDLPAPVAKRTTPADEPLSLPLTPPDTTTSEEVAPALPTPEDAVAEASTEESPAPEAPAPTAEVFAAMAEDTPEAQEDAVVTLPEKEVAVLEAAQPPPPLPLVLPSRHTGRLKEVRQSPFKKHPYPYMLVNSEGTPFAYLDFSEAILASPLHRYLNRTLTVNGRATPVDSHLPLVITVRSLTLQQP